MSSVQPRKDEKLILQEDCSEDHFKNGLLTLTNQRVFFEKTEGNLTTLNKKIGNALLNTTLDKVGNVNAEGFILTKVVVQIDNSKYKFSVFNSKKWAKEIEAQKALFNK